MIQADDSLFGVDYSNSGELTSSGDISLVSGLDNAKQNIKSWLLTDKGFYPSIDENYGSNISEALGYDTVESTISAVSVHIINALLENPRVEEIISVNPYRTIKDVLMFQISVILVNGESESFSISIGE